MALENIQQSVTLTGESKIEDNVVVTFSSHIPSNGIAGSVTTNIRDIERYNAHRNQVRRDQADFQQEVWAEEDRLAAEAAEEEATE